MEKRAILAAILSMIVLLGYQYFFLGPRMQAEREAQEKLAEAKKTPPQAEVPRKEPPPKLKEGPLPPTPPPAPLDGGEEVTVDTGVARIVLTTRGAAIKQVYLLRHEDSSGEPIKLVVADKGKAPLLLPLQFRSDGPFAKGANDGLYQANRNTLTLTPDAPLGEVALTLRGNGHVRKTLSFQYGSYAMDVRLEWSREGAPQALSVLWGPGIGGEGGNNWGYSHSGPVTLLGTKRVENPEELKAIRNWADLKWTSLHSKYFMAALIPRDPIEGGALVEKTSDGIAVGLEFPGDKGGASFSLYAGPKEHSRLKAYGASLEQAIDFGWFGFVAKPLLLALNFLYGLTSNYGWAIIILTAFIKVIFYPLTHKSTKSMQAMTKLQPKMKALREIYKGDKQRLNEEVMKVYREHKVNPLGGCLPMLLQIPVFFALYRVLLDSIELRRAPFLWIKDLSAAEPIPIFVILMGASMWLQQKMTPSTMDPTQAKMMMFMPIVFTIMFWSFPVGLVIYWLANNLLSIGQQYVMNKWALSPDVTSKG